MKLYLKDLKKNLKKLNLNVAFLKLKIYIDTVLLIQGSKLPPLADQD